MARGYETASYVASAKEKAIACSSTDAKPRCNSNVSSEGNLRA